MLPINPGAWNSKPLNMATMKYKIITGISLLLAFNGIINAQTLDDALTYSLTQSNGTARSISLGGAMGALGGDYSAISINPAGIAVYRSSEFSFTPSLIFNQTESWYDRTADNNAYSNNTSASDKFSFPINHISYVGTSRLMREANKGIVSSHFAIGYSRTQNYNRESFIQGSNINSSLLDEFIYEANTSELTPFHSKLAYESYLLDPISEETNNGYYNAFEYLDDDGIPQWGPDNGLNQNRVISESGYSGNFDLTYGINISNTLLLGGTFTLATLNYEKDYEHYEEVAASDNQWDYLNNYSFAEKLSTNGTGIKLKIGAIYKPVHAIRIGASFQTPTFYSINEEFQTSIRIPDEFVQQVGADRNVYESDYGDFSYNFRTPLKATASLAYIIGAKGLISLDYEYTDFGNMKFKSKEAATSDISYLNDLNNQMSEVYGVTHNFRIGAEYRVLPALSLRAGGATYQTPYKNQLVINKENGSQERLDIESDKFDVSGGIGYKHQNMTIDIAYMYRQQTNIKSLYYSPYVSDEAQYPAEISSKDHLLAVTLGWRF